MTIESKQPQENNPETAEPNGQVTQAPPEFHWLSRISNAVKDSINPEEREELEQLRDEFTDYLHVIGLYE